MILALVSLSSFELEIKITIAKLPPFASLTIPTSLNAAVIPSSSVPQGEIALC
jgi:hypothetical protein